MSPAPGCHLNQDDESVLEENIPTKEKKYFQGT